MIFYFGALLLGLTACLFILLPMLTGSRRHSVVERTELNVALYEEHVGELADREDVQQLRLEAQKALLSDVAEEAPGPPESVAGRQVLLFVAGLLPVFAALIYLDAGFGRGSMPDVQLTQQMLATSPADRPAYRRFVAQVEARAEQQPDDEDIHFLLARAYLNLEEFSESAAVMRALLGRFPDDPNLLSQYAEVLYLKAGRQMTGEVDGAVSEALRANPGDVTMMEIRAISAIEAGDRDTGLTWFQRALATGVTGRRAEIIRTAINHIGGDGSQPATSGGRSLQVRVSRAAGLDLADAAVVFVYARAASGPAAPLAVQRFPVAALPVELVLDESMAMVPGMSIGNFDEVIVIARISQTGQVAPSPGDYEARSDVIDLTGTTNPVKLDIIEAIQ